MTDTEIEELYTEAVTVLEEVTSALRIHAPGTPLNNHRFDGLGIKANAVILKHHNALPRLLSALSQRGRDEALEEAAKVAEAVCADPAWHPYFGMGARAAAKAIRSLVSPDREKGSAAGAAPRPSTAETTAALKALIDSIVEMEAYNDVPGALKDPVWVAIRKRGSEALARAIALLPDCSSAEHGPENDRFI